MPATAAKLPIIRKSGKVATCALVRKPVASVAKVTKAGLKPMKGAVPTSPVNPMTLVADHEWSRVGSSNLNVSSLLGNYELDLVAEHDGLTATLATQFLHDMAESREIGLMARRRLPLPPRLVDAEAVKPGHAVTPAHPTPTTLYKRTLRERQAAAAVALMQAAGGARRMIAGTAAVLFFIIGASLILFPIIASTVLAVGALAASLWLAGFALARRRRRRESDVH